MCIKVFSQEELKNIFEHKMNEKEQQMILKLDLDSIIKTVRKSTMQVKYIENIGYVFISEGYLILKNGAEQTHYFATICSTEQEAKSKLYTI